MFLLISDLESSEKNSEEHNKENKGLQTTLSTIARVSQIGFTFAFSILFTLGIGYWLDKIAHTEKLFKLIFLVIGVGAGLLNVYKTLQKFIDFPTNK